MSMIPERRFWLLRRIATAMAIFAWIIFGFIIVATPWVLIRMLLGDTGYAGGWFEWIKTAASGLLVFINLLWIAQSIQVILAIEENTKQSTYVLEKLTTLAQQIRDRLAENAERDSEP
jgi:uncharacterized membrane protein